MKTPKPQIFELFGYISETMLFKQNESLFKFLNNKKEEEEVDVGVYYLKFKETLIKNSISVIF
jgi:hypothetical protein